MVNTYDGNTPSDPPTPTVNDGYLPVTGNTADFEYYAAAGQNKRTKLRLRAFNAAGAGPTSDVFSYSINLNANLSVPSAIAVTPSSGSWTSSPHHLAVQSTGATAIYFTMVNTYDGSTPSEPPTPTINDGYLPVTGDTADFEYYATAGQYKRTKLKFRAFNAAGAGSTSSAYAYKIDRR